MGEVVSLLPLPYSPPGERIPPWYPLQRRLSKHHSQSEHFGETIILLFLPEIE